MNGKLNHRDAEAQSKNKLTAFDILPLKIVDMETMEKKSVAGWISEVKKLRRQLHELAATARQTLLTPRNGAAKDMLVVSISASLRLCGKK